MRTRIFLLVASAFLFLQVNAQNSGVSINSNGAAPDPSSMLDVSGTSKGVLINRMTTVQRDAIVSPAKGLQIYNLDCDNLNFNAGTPSAPNWVAVTAANSVIVSVNITANPVGAICQNQSVTFTAGVTNGGNNPGYQWTKNGININGENDATYTSSSLSNGDVISCVVSSDAPCVVGSPATSNGIAVIVNPSVSSSVSITASPSQTICSGTSVTFTATPINGGISPGYQWKNGGSDIFGATNATYTTSSISNNDAITCVMTSNQICATGSPATSNSIGMTVNANPVSTFTPANGLTNTPVTFTPTLSGAGYSWTFADGSPSTSTTENPNVTWSGAGSYNVTLTVTANGCSTQSSNTISIVAPTVVTYNYTGNAQSFVVPQGVTSVLLECWGARGDNGNGGGIGGLGGYAKGNLAVSPGQTLYLYVGGTGTHSCWSNYSGGFNGGGPSNSQTCGGVGGGGTDVRVGGNAWTDRVIVAGGGGGGAHNASNGGAGGGTIGNAGANNNSPFLGGGGGGTQSTGGAGGSGVYNGEAGSLGVGGHGGYAPSYGYGGSGGGGYYGGGGGASDNTGSGNGGGGGGGSSYIGGVINGLTQAGIQNGHGQIVITY